MDLDLEPGRRVALVGPTGAGKSTLAALLCGVDPRRAGRSTLLITHDLDCLDQLDEIVVLDGGRVAERGTHAGLLRARTGSSGPPADWYWRAAHLRTLPSAGLGGGARTRRYRPNL